MRTAVKAYQPCTNVVTGKFKVSDLVSSKAITVNGLQDIKIVNAPNDLQKIEMQYLRMCIDTNQVLKLA